MELPIHPLRHEPIAYASHGAYRRSRPFSVFSIVSAIVAIFTIFICGAAILGARGEILQVRQDQLHRSEAYQAEFQYRYDFAIHTIGIFICLLLLGLLLLISAIALSRSELAGVFLHRLYAVMQLLVCTAFALLLMSDMYHSPADMVFYVGAIPGLIGCIYPLVLLLALRRND
jgi:hypothetical protein